MTFYINRNSLRRNSISIVSPRDISRKAWKMRKTFELVEGATWPNIAPVSRHCRILKELP